MNTEMRQPHTMVRHDPLTALYAPVITGRRP
jgi:hypothetical protein